MSVDPLAGKYPFYTPYQYAGNKPINKIDIDGMQENGEPMQGGGTKVDHGNDEFNAGVDSLMRLTNGLETQMEYSINTTGTGEEFRGVISMRFNGGAVNNLYFSPESGFQHPELNEGNTSAGIYSQPLGAGLGGISDGVERGGYVEAIHKLSKQKTTAFDNAVGKGEFAEARSISESASAERNSIRKATQQALPFGSKAMSEVIDKKWTWNELYSKYMQAENGNEISALRRITVASGSSNRIMTKLSLWGKGLGALSTVVGAVFAGDRVISAAPEDRVMTAIAEGKNSGGGYLGGQMAFLSIARLVGRLRDPRAIVAALIVGGIVGGVTGSSLSEMIQQQDHWLFRAYEYSTSIAMGLPGILLTYFSH